GAGPLPHLCALARPGPPGADARRRRPAGVRALHRRFDHRGAGRRPRGGGRGRRRRCHRARRSLGARGCALAVSDGADAQGSRGGGGDHLLPLAGGWTAWSWIWLRSAGFPADTVLALATERAAAAAARVGALEQAVDQRRRAAAAACEALLPDARGAASGALARALRRLAAGQPAEPSPDVPAPARAAREAAQAADAELAAARAALTDELARDTAAARRALQALLASGPMREALVWQNRRAVRGSVAGFLRRAPE